MGRGSRAQATVHDRRSAIAVVARIPAISADMSIRTRTHGCRAQDLEPRHAYALDKAVALDGSWISGSLLGDGKDVLVARPPRKPGDAALVGRAAAAHRGGRRPRRGVRPRRSGRLGPGGLGFLDEISAVGVGVMLRSMRFRWFAESSLCLRADPWNLRRPMESCRHIFSVLGVPLYSAEVLLDVRRSRFELSVLR